VRIALRNTRSVPPIGTAIRADIVTDVHKNVVTVPPSAIVRNEGKMFVYVAGGDKKAHRREVKPGFSSEAAIEILSGVAAGDNVLVRGHQALPDGAAIRPEEPAEKADEKDEKNEKGDKKDAGKPQK
jgi:multidrug efflux pump subunit AcrA (membrane-fusion protein)